MGVIADKMNLKPGDLGFTRITGFTGFWVNLGQALTGDSCRFTHVFVVMDDDTVLEAMPSGARYAPLDREYKTDVVYARLPLTDEQRAKVVTEARRLMAQPGGIPYSFTDYLALALKHFGINAKWLRKYIQNSGRMICSQLADYLLSHSGFKVFDDGRLHQDVTPGDLYYGTDSRILGTQKAGTPAELPTQPPLD
jgi:hypothetical protein